MPPFPTPILRFTHVDNLATIIRRGGLHAPNHVPEDGLAYRFCHSAEVQSARADVPVHLGPGGTIHDYVPFYFGYLSPMMLKLKTGQVDGYAEGQAPLIYLVSSAQAVQDVGLDFVFSDGHGLARFTDWFDDLNRLDAVDWMMVNQQYRSGPIPLNSRPSFFSGVSADAYAASLPVGSITAYASSGVCLSRLECGLD